MSQMGSESTLKPGRADFQATREHLVEWGKVIFSKRDLPLLSNTYILEKIYGKSSFSKLNLSLLPKDIHLQDDSNTFFLPVPSVELEMHKQAFKHPGISLEKKALLLVLAME